MLLALSLLWGGSFFFVGVVVNDLPPLTIVTLRVALAALTLWIVLAVLGVPVPRAPRIWSAFLGMGLLNNVIPFSLFVWGQTHISSGLASILNATTPLFTVLIAGFLLADERLTPGKLAGVAAGLFGVLVLIGPDALDGFQTSILAQLACLVAAFSYGLAGAFGRRFRRLGVDPMVAAAGQVTASALVLAPIAIWIDEPWTFGAPDTVTWAAILALAVLSTACAYILYFRILATAGATNLLLVTFLVPVTAVLLGWLVLDESLVLRHFAGMALIGTGLAAIDGRLLVRASRKQPMRRG